MIHLCEHTLLRADIAQLVEQRIRNAKVVGSTPIIGTILFKYLSYIQVNYILLLCRIRDIATNNRVKFARVFNQVSR